MTLRCLEATMTVARRMYPFAAVGLAFALAGAPTEVEAQGGGLTCGWCVMRGDVVDEGDDWAVYEDIEHKFPRGGDQCGWEGRDEESIAGGPYCSRCGGSSVCHSNYRDGGCHRACGPLGDLFTALDKVEDALERGDVTTVAAALGEPRTGGSLDFIPAAGRINIVLACNPGRVFGAIPVLPEVRDRLRSAMVLHPPSSTK